MKKYILLFLFITTSLFSQTWTDEQWRLARKGDIKGEPILFVAASNASAIEKHIADFLCDGTNDDVQIQAAFDSTNNVKLSSGSFYLSAAVDMTVKGIIKGENKEQTKVYIDGDYAFKLRKSGSVISDIYMKGDSTASTAGVYAGIDIKNIKIENIYSEGFGTGILAPSVDSILINNCYTKNNLNEGVYIKQQSGHDAPSRAFIYNVTSDSNGRYGISFEGGTDAQIKNCYSSYNVLGGFHTENSHNVLFDNCTSYNNLGTAISASTNTYDITLRNSKMIGGGTSGVSISGDVIGNYFENNKSWALQHSGTHKQIINNIVNGGERGIRTTGDYVIFTNNLITGTTYNSSTAGAFYIASDSSLIANNIFYGNAGLGNITATSVAYYGNVEHLNTNSFIYGTYTNKGLDISASTIRLRTAKTPSSATDTGTQGQFCWDSNYFYICTATNTWKRIAIATW